jgi:hypothetical protein
VFSHWHMTTLKSLWHVSSTIFHQKQTIFNWFVIFSIHSSPNKIWCWTFMILKQEILHLPVLRDWRLGLGLQGRDFKPPHQSCEHPIKSDSDRESCCIATKTKTKLHGPSPRANYTERATATCRQSECQLLQIEGATWSAWRIPPAVFSVF